MAKSGKSPKPLPGYPDGASGSRYPECFNWLEAGILFRTRRWWRQDRSILSSHGHQQHSVMSSVSMMGYYFCLN